MKPQAAIYEGKIVRILHFYEDGKVLIEPHLKDGETGVFLRVHYTHLNSSRDW